MEDRKEWLKALKNNEIALDKQNAKSFEEINQNLADAISAIELAGKNLMLMPVADQGNPYPGVESWSDVMDKFFITKKMIKEVKKIFEKGYKANQ